MLCSCGLINLLWAEDGWCGYLWNIKCDNFGDLNMVISSVNSVWLFCTLCNTPAKILFVIYVCSNLMPIHSCTEQKCVLEACSMVALILQFCSSETVSGVSKWLWGIVDLLSKLFLNFHLKNGCFAAHWDHGFCFSVLHVLKRLEERIWQWSKSGINRVPGPYCSFPLCSTPCCILDISDIVGSQLRVSSCVAGLLCCFQTTYVWWF